MKLSDIKGDRCIDVIADLIDPVASIAQDKDTASIFKRSSKKVSEEQAKKQISARIKKALPSIMKRHKDDIISILSTIKGVTPEEYSEGMTLASLLVDAMDLVTDGEFIGFLASYMTQKQSEPAGSASENTEGRAELTVL